MSYDDFFDGSNEPWVSQWGVVEYYDEDAEEQAKTRIWKTRIDGVRQRYWVKGIIKGKYVRKRGRFNWSGTRRDVGEAIAIAKDNNFVPDGFVDIRASDFLRNPFKTEAGNRVKMGLWITHGVDTRE